MSEFSHVNQSNQPCMVDVSQKKETNRFAHARTEVWLPKIIRDQFIDGDIKSKKGPVFQTAIIAATMALKNTSQIIPFCHQINIEGSSVEINMVGESAVIDCKANTSGKTGIEMEALVGAQIAALTIYDMCKAFGHDMKIQNGHLVEKTGGKSDYEKK